MRASRSSSSSGDASAAAAGGSSERAVTVGWASAARSAATASPRPSASARCRRLRFELEWVRVEVVDLLALAAPQQLHPVRHGARQGRREELEGAFHARPLEGRCRLVGIRVERRVVLRDPEPCRRRVDPRMLLQTDTLGDQARQLGEAVDAAGRTGPDVTRGTWIRRLSSDRAWAIRPPSPKILAVVGGDDHERVVEDAGSVEALEQSAPASRPCSGSERAYRRRIRSRVASGTSTRDPRRRARSPSSV